MGLWDGSSISRTTRKQSARRSRQITTTTPHHSISTGRMLFLTPHQQCQSTEGITNSWRKLADFLSFLFVRMWQLKWTERKISVSYEVLRLCLLFWRGVLCAVGRRSDVVACGSQEPLPSYCHLWSSRLQQVCWATGFNEPDLIWRLILLDTLAAFRGWIAD